LIVVLCCAVQGKMETKAQKQCKDYIRPLFKLCKQKEMPDTIRRNLVRMVDFCIEGEFVKVRPGPLTFLCEHQDLTFLVPCCRCQANAVYLQTAIGNAPWPIGLTMVGIHERTGREKIMENKVAHVMNNEMQRKYLTSVKRLMAYAQDKRPDVPPSKKVRS
jgi:pre-mRNA-splicing factor 18